MARRVLAGENDGCPSRRPLFPRTIVKCRRTDWEKVLPDLHGSSAVSIHNQERVELLGPSPIPPPRGCRGDKGAEQCCSQQGREVDKVGWLRIIYPRTDGAHRDAQGASEMKTIGVVMPLFLQGWVAVSHNAAIYPGTARVKRPPWPDKQTIGLPRRTFGPWSLRTLLWVPRLIVANVAGKDE